MGGDSAWPRPPAGPDVRSGPGPAAAVRVRPGAAPPIGRTGVFGRRGLPDQHEPLFLDDLHRSRPLRAGLAAELSHPDPAARDPLPARLRALAAGLDTGSA